MTNGFLGFQGVVEYGNIIVVTGLIGILYGLLSQYLISRTYKVCFPGLSFKRVQYITQVRALYVHAIVTVVGSYIVWNCSDYWNNGIFVLTTMLWSGVSAWCMFFVSSNFWFLMQLKSKKFK